MTFAIVSSGTYIVAMIILILVLTLYIGYGLKIKNRQGLILVMLPTLAKRCGVLGVALRDSRYAGARDFLRLPMHPFSSVIHFNLRSRNL